MPLYEFRCARPGCYRVELFLPMARAGEPQVCGCGLPLERVYSVAHIQTGSTFVAMGATGGGQFCGFNRERILAEARRHGVSTDGKFYEGRIARFPGDPEAWVQSRDEVKAVLERRGWGCDGDFKVKAEPVEPGKGPAIAEDIVEEMVERKLEENPGANVAEVREIVTETHKPHWAA